MSDTEPRELQPNGLVPSKGGENIALTYPYLEYANGEPGGNSRVEPLLDYWEALWKRKWRICLFSFFGILFAFGVTRLIQPRYRATTVLELQNLNEDFLNIKDVSPTSSNSFQSPEFNIRTQVAVLQSRPVLERTLDQMNIQSRLLHRPPSKLNALVHLMNKFRKPGEAGSPREAALAALSGGLNVHNEPGSRILKIEFESTDSPLAADVANSLATSFVELNMERRLQSSQSISKWLSRQLDDARGDLRHSEQAMQKYADEQKVTILSEKDNPAEEGLRQIQSEIAKAQADRIAKQSQYELASKAPEESLPEILDDPTLKDYQVQLTTLRQQLAELSIVLTTENPRVAKVEAQIAALESALQKKKEAIISRIKNDFKSAERRENLLVGQYNAQLKLLTEQSNSVSHYLSLKREVDSNRQLYDSLFQRVKEAGMASLMRASDISITETAVPPKTPYSPSRILNVALGAMLGLCAGAWLAVRQAHAELKMALPGDISVRLRTRELGVIPSVAESVPRRRLPFMAPVLDLSPAPLEMIANQKSYSAAAESYRFALASILMAKQRGVPVKTVAITSSIPGEGKTTVSCNLAISLAKIKNKVLLIDGDMRRPRLHAVFAVDNSIGIAHFLNGDGMPRIMETKIPGLFLIPSETERDVELLFSPKLPELLAQFREDFDMVLIDCPPLLQMPDARLISRQADAAILVIAQQTPQPAVLLARQYLMEDGTNLLGTIFNNWKFSHSENGYYPYGYYGRRTAS